MCGPGNNVPVGPGEPGGAEVLLFYLERFKKDVLRIWTEMSILHEGGRNSGWDQWKLPLPPKLAP